MFIALDRNNTPCAAWETTRADGPFTCPNPECGGQVVLKQGEIRVHHFAHMPPACELGCGGEGEVHMRAKRSIFEALVEHPDTTNCALERYLGPVRPDISLRIRGVPVAIEIQKSSISVELIRHRMAAYTKMGINVLWVLPNDPPDISHDGHSVCRPRPWEKYLHAMYFGRLYAWDGNGAHVGAFHMKDHYIYVEEREVGYESYGGYNRFSKSMKRIEWHDYYLNIVDDFHATNRQPYRNDSMDIPAVRMWADTGRKWW